MGHTTQIGGGEMRPFFQHNPKTLIPLNLFLFILALIETLDPAIETLDPAQSFTRRDSFRYCTAAG